MNKYIVIFYNKLYFKEVLFRRLIDYYMDFIDYEVVLITNKKLNINIKQYSNLKEMFKECNGKYFILNKVSYFKNLNELNDINTNLNIYKNNKYVGKFIVNKNDRFLNYEFKCFLYIIYNNYSLNYLSTFLKKSKIQQLVRCGVTIIDPSNTYITTDSMILKNTTIYPNTYIISSTIKENCSIGPFANIKKNSLIFDNVRIGNFVEIKNSIINSNTKIAHHAYIGDSIIGSFVNIGCGVITCNYDGINKNNIIIGDRSFIGSNVNLISPLKIGKDTYIASGSTVYNDVEDKDFVIARSYQVNKKGYSIKYPYYQKFSS